MYKIEANPQKNRLYITLEDLETEDIKPILKNLDQCVADLKPGFTCLVDIRKLEFDLNGKGSEYVEIIQGALSDSGMGDVVRVVDPKNKEHHIRMDEQSISLGYKAKAAETVEEAEALFDKK